jgi:alginate O-acetyltransferase complex protein AlgI
MFALTIIAWYSGIQIAHRKRRRYAVLGIVIPLVVLGFFKYFNFFILSFATAFGIGTVGMLRIILPVGISFYTFQTMSYIVVLLYNTEYICYDMRHGIRCGI